MIIERTVDEFVIRIPFSTNTQQIQDIVDYLRYKELTANYQVAQAEVDSIAKDINRKWWDENSAKFSK
jgi:hypothetical protein